MPLTVFLVGCFADPGPIADDDPQPGSTTAGVESSTGGSSSSSNVDGSSSSSSDASTSFVSSSDGSSSSEDESSSGSSSGTTSAGCIENFFEGWESESFDTNGWTRGGATPSWFIADWPPAVFAGTWAVASDSPPPGTSNWIRTTIDLPEPGELTFRFWTSIAPSDRLVVAVDGEEVAAYEGTHGAASEHEPAGPIALPAGSIELELRYERGVVDVVDYDELFIDDLSICWPAA